jgi:imidazole glycerol phosphate synthase subunit HisF
VCELGARETLLTSIEPDGAMQGCADDLIGRVSSTVSIPVITSGGAGDCPDMRAAVQAGASAVAAASIFHFTERTPLEIKRYLRSTAWVMSMRRRTTRDMLAAWRCEAGVWSSCALIPELLMVLQ